MKFLGKLSSNNNNIQTFGFQSTKCAPSVHELADFEKDMMLMVKNIGSWKINNNFQQKLKEDIKYIKFINEVLVPAKKLRNIYKLENDHYRKPLRENVTKTYKKSNLNKVCNINNKAKKITENLSVADKIDNVQGKKAYRTIKDHKDYFPNRISCQLKNPCKSIIGKISKAILDRINTAVRNHTKVNQWKHTSTVTDWFKNIQDKKSCDFMLLNIENIYPSISGKLFSEAIQYTKNIVEITDNDMIIINHSRRSLLFHENEPWIKNGGSKEFDVTMGNNDVLVISELVGLFMLNKLGHFFKITLLGYIKMMG